MEDVLICDFIRTPIGRYAGALSAVRADDLAALPIKYLKDKHPNLPWNTVDEVFLGCANQAGEVAWAMPHKPAAYIRALTTMTRKAPKRSANMPEKMPNKPQQIF